MCSKRGPNCARIWMCILPMYADTNARTVRRLSKRNAAGIDTFNCTLESVLRVASAIKRFSGHTVAENTRMRTIAVVMYPCLNWWMTGLRSKKSVPWRIPVQWLLRAKRRVTQPWWRRLPIPQSKWSLETVILPLTEWINSAHCFVSLCFSSLLLIWCASVLFRNSIHFFSSTKSTLFRWKFQLNIAYCVNGKEKWKLKKYTVTSDLFCSGVIWNSLIQRPLEVGSGGGNTHPSNHVLLFCFAIQTKHCLLREPKREMESIRNLLWLLINLQWHLSHSLYFVTRWLLQLISGWKFCATHGFSLNRIGHLFLKQKIWVRISKPVCFCCIQYSSRVRVERGRAVQQLLLTWWSQW